MISFNQNDVADKLAKFIWNFKVGDNVAYNFRILFFLNSIKKGDESILNKPIVLIVMSIIEGIFYDLVCRLDGATSHFPDSIDLNKKIKIQEKIEKDKKWFTYKDDFLGGNRYKRIKNYKFSELISFFAMFELLGEKNDVIYHTLKEANLLRNRIHIFNWSRNLEIDEDRAFNVSRLIMAERLLEDILNLMVIKYPRPFISGQKDVWMSKM